MAWWSVAFLGCRPLAALVDGAIADLVGVRVAIGVAASVAVAAAAIALLVGERGLSTDGVD
jgi:Asp/Glu/hydantoin racemase